MPASISRQDSVKDDMDALKPVNVFYVWYGELCRRLNMQPLSSVKPAKPKNEAVLDFAADRIKPEEWAPIINALRLDTSLHVIAIRSRVQCKFLHDVDTEDKAKHMKRRAGSLFTTYILKSLLKSLAISIKKNIVLASLELDGVPITIDYVDGLLEALKKSNSIKVLAIKYCSLRDLGCQLLCNALRHIPNIEVLNLTACGLGPLSAQYIAKVVKFQQINRYCESWHNSLRYEDPEVGIMAGLKRITLNNNPNIKDEGLTYILDELDDDLWIKAIDMQRCGITENVATRLVDVIEYSRSLEVADFRANDQLSPRTLQRVLEILKHKQKFGYESEYQWCLTATTLPPEGSVNESLSVVSSKIPMKSKSVPFKQTNTSIIPMQPLRRMKTCISIINQTKTTSEKYKTTQCNNLADAKKDALSLNDELQKEIAKRIQSELENKKLKHELEKIKSSCTLESSITSKEKVVKFDPMPKPDNKRGRNPKPKSGVVLKAPSKVEFVFENKSNAQSILQNIVKQHVVQDSESDNEIDQYFNEILEEGKHKYDDEKDLESNDSNASLIKFMKEMKNVRDENGSGSRKLWNGNKNTNYYQKVVVH